MVAGALVLYAWAILDAGLGTKLGFCIAAGWPGQHLQWQHGGWAGAGGQGDRPRWVHHEGN